MPEDRLTFLGKRIRTARKDCGLTQQELAEQAGIAIKTLQDVENGKKNTTYETLCRLIERLGISANFIFPIKTSINDEETQRFIGKFQSCDPENQQILFNTLDFLSEQLLIRQNQKQQSKLE